MDGIVSGFDPAFDTRVREIWSLLAERCGTSGVLVTPIPHFSWVVGEGLDFKGIHAPLDRLAREVQPFEVRTSGLGIFTGPDVPVLFIAIVKDPQLQALHERICAEITGFFDAPVPYYAPDHWVPHITIAFGDLDSKRLACAVQTLAHVDLHWTIPISSFEVFDQPADGTAVLHRAYTFGGNPVQKIDP